VTQKLSILDDLEGHNQYDRLS